MGKARTAGGLAVIQVRGALLHVIIGFTSSCTYAVTLITFYTKSYPTFLGFFFIYYYKRLNIILIWSLINTKKIFL